MKKTLVIHPLDGPVFVDGLQPDEKGRVVLGRGKYRTVIDDPPDNAHLLWLRVGDGRNWMKCCGVGRDSMSWAQGGDANNLHHSLWQGLYLVHGDATLQIETYSHSINVMFYNGEFYAVVKEKEYRL